jgi:hypothetical protein
MSEQEYRSTRAAPEIFWTGKIPERRPDRMWGGRGNGRDICQICGKPLLTEDVAFDLEYDRQAGETGTVCCSVHVRCFNEWHIGREALATPADAGPPRVGSDKALPLSAAVADGTMAGSERDTSSSSSGNS